MITTGSVRGKCSAPQLRAERGDSRRRISAVARAAIGTEAVPLVPVDQRLGLAGDGGVAARQAQRPRARREISEAAQRPFVRRIASPRRCRARTAAARRRGPGTRRRIRRRHASHSQAQQPSSGGAPSPVRSGRLVLPEGQEQARSRRLRRQPGRIGAPVAGAVQRIAGERDHELLTAPQPYDRIPSKECARLFTFRQRLS